MPRFPGSFEHHDECKRSEYVWRIFAVWNEICKDFSMSAGRERIFKETDMIREKISWCSEVGFRPGDRRMRDTVNRTIQGVPFRRRAGSLKESSEGYYSNMPRSAGKTANIPLPR